MRATQLAQYFCVLPKGRENQIGQFSQHFSARATSGGGQASKQSVLVGG